MIERLGFDNLGAYTFGAMAVELDVDEVTGKVEVLRAFAAQDAGKAVNPGAVEGQIQGGVMQGLGQVLLEQAVYDSSGQLVTGSFMDYAMPRAHDAPMINVANHPVPTKTNPIGAKGCGEAGAIAAFPAIANAILDALAPLGVENFDGPASPAHIWQAMQAAR